MPKHRGKEETDLVKLARAISATEQPDFINAARVVLAALLDGATVLRHMRMYPEFLSEAVRRILTENSVRLRRPRKQ